MAFQRRFQKSNEPGVGAGAFKSKSGEVFVAKFSGDWFKKLIQVIKEAQKEAEPGLVLFIRKNERKTEKDPHLKVSVKVDKPMKKTAIRNNNLSDPGLDGDSDADDLDGGTEDTDFN